MRRSLVPVLVVAVFGGLVRAAPAAEKESPAPHVTRVLYLQGLDAEEAAKWLRVEVQPLHIAAFVDRDVVVVSDIAEQVDASESLLRQKDAVAHASTPHAPLDHRHLADSLPATREYRIAGDHTKGVVAMLRGLYQVRQPRENPETNSVTVDAALPVLDAIEAFLAELNLLSEPRTEQDPGGR
jgi:hypothetical protein